MMKRLRRKPQQIICPDSCSGRGAKIRALSELAFKSINKEIVAKGGSPLGLRQSDLSRCSYCGCVFTNGGMKLGLYNAPMSEPGWKPT